MFYFFIITGKILTWSNFSNKYPISKG